MCVEFTLDTSNGNLYLNDFLISSKKNIKRLIVIQGPTASGKTALSVAVAKHFETEIISADSRQFYKEMSIGTAKPTLDEQQGIKHHFIDSHSVADEVSAARFAKEAELILNNLFRTREVVVLTGGSGMFVDALCQGIDDIPTDFQLRDELISFVESNGTTELLKELAEKDPVYFNQVDHSNPSRIIRAIQVIRSTGKPFSEQRTGQKKINNFEIVRFIIEHPREQLYQRINHRVDQMIETGLIDEVRSLEAFRNLNALRTVGYKEVFDYLEGKVDLNSTVDLIKQHSRNYAKRQITWLKRYSEAKFIQYRSTKEMLTEIIHDLRNLP